MKRISIFLLVFTIFAGCKEKNPAAIKNGELTVCYKSMLKDTVDIPLSLLTEELQIVKLDDADSALVKDNDVMISDNYIVVFGSGNIPLKLFERKTGKYISDIGAVGQGPGEYGNVFQVQIDEANNSIYVVPTPVPSYIFSYDMEGNLREYLPVIRRVPRTIFHVNKKDSIITFAALPFHGLKNIIWTQKPLNQYRWTVIQDYPTGSLSVDPDYSNEIIGGFNNEGIFDFFIFNFFKPRPDSLYHYDIAENKLTPVFTLDFGGSEISPHAYMELPQHYIGSVAIVLETSGAAFGTYTSAINKFYIVDKKTLKASYFRLKNDFLGNMEIDDPVWKKFQNGYFIQNFDPSILLEQLENTLASNKKLSEKMRTKLTELKNSINEDRDNNYILYAKLKK